MPNSRSRVLVIVPAYNEEESLLHTIAELKPYLGDGDGYTLDYVIVNDGSSDSTAQICSQKSLPFLDLPVNCGLATAFQTGMKYAESNGYDYAIQFDADGQHDPAYLESMIRAAIENGANIVIGSRFIDAKKDFSMRMIGSRFISAIIKLTTGQKIVDPTSGMRMFDRGMISRFAKANHFAPEPDTIAFAMRTGAKVLEMPVVMRERFAGSSYLTATKSISYMLRMGLSILLFQWVREG